MYLLGAKSRQKIIRSPAQAIRPLGGLQAAVS